LSPSWLSENLQNPSGRMPMNKNDAKRVLKEILAIQSVNAQDDEGNVARYLKRFFKVSGIKSRIQKIDKTHANLISVLPGRDERKNIIWNGHMDTVPYGDISKWNTDPGVPVEKGGRIYARGSSDMKSGLAAMAYTLVSLAEKGIKPAETIWFIATCDEEKNGLGAQKTVSENMLPAADCILIGEPTGLDIGVAQKGCIWLSFDIKGQTSHGAYPERGINAVDYAVKIADELKEVLESKRHPVLKKATAQITEINGGAVPNMTPDNCSVIMDIRLIPGICREDVLREFDRISYRYKELTKGILQVERTVLNERRAIEISSQDKFLKVLEKHIRSGGITPQKIGINFFTDASIFTKEEDHRVLLFGPGEPDLCHCPNEYVDMEKYYRYIDILTSFAIDKAV